MTNTTNSLIVGIDFSINYPTATIFDYRDFYFYSMCFKKPTKNFYDKVTQLNFVKIDIKTDLSTKNMNKIFLTNMYERAYAFYKGLNKFLLHLNLNRKARVVVEEPTLGRSGGTNLNMSFGVGVLSGLLRYKSGHFVYFVSPSKLKKTFSNYGLASKKDMSRVFMSTSFEGLNPKNVDTLKQLAKPYIDSDTLSLPKPLDDIIDSFALVIYDLMYHQK